MLLSLSGVGKTFGAERIFSDITITVEPGERIALIGPNGAGKTTLLDLIAGVTQPDEGIISAQPGIRVGYLRQNGGLEAMGTIESEMRAALGDIYALEQDMMVIYEQMALVTDHQCDNYRALEAEHQRLDDLYASRDGYQADVKINRVLTGMGFGAFDRTALVTTLSGGERTRLRLCKLLVEQPELLILDEATNHLDFAMLSWLEDYLSSYHGAVLTVSHDRYFLDRVTRITWELEGLAVVRYPAPYSGYLTLRSERLARLEKEYERHHQEEARLLDYAERNMARASTAASAKSRLRQIARMGEAERPPMILKPPLIRFTTRLRPVSQVLSVEGLTLTVGEGEEQRVLLRDFDLLLKRGERVAVIGENGAGKSTLLKAISGRMMSCGSIQWGRNVQMSFFEQDSSDLAPDKTALMELWDRFPQSSERQLRTLLGGLGLSGDEVFKQVGVLSGGERARLKLARLMLEEGNVLVLDEPTNHLDIPAKEALEAALAAYEGTILVVSHDRWLLSRLPTRILHLENGTAQCYQGAFDAFLAARGAEQTPPAISAPSQGEALSASCGDYHRSRAQRAAEAARRKRFAELETEIEQTESALSAVETALADPANAGDYQTLTELTESIGALQVSLEALYAEWDSFM